MTLLERIKKENKPLIQLDSGHLFLKPGMSPDKKETIQNAELIAKAYRAMGVDAVNVGDMDLNMGLDFLREKAGEGLTFISANIVGKKDRRPIFPPFIIRELSGIRLGIFGLFQASSRYVSKEILKEIVLNDPYEVAETMVNELKEKADVIICLSDLGKRGDRLLAKKVEGIHFILGSHDGEYFKEPLRVERTLIVQHYKKGMYLGRIDLIIAGREFSFHDSGSVERLSRKLAQIKRRILALKKRKNNPSAEAHIERLEKTKEDIEKKLSEAKSSSVSGSRFVHRNISLGDDIPDHKSWNQIINSEEGKPTSTK